MKIQEMIEILEAYQEGKTIQVYSRISKNWIDEKNPMWNFTVFNYRIKPEKTNYYYRVIKINNHFKLGHLVTASEPLTNDYLREITKEQYDNNSLSYEDNWLLGMKVENKYLINGNKNKSIIDNLGKDFITLSNGASTTYETFFNTFKFID